MDGCGETHQGQEQDQRHFHHEDERTMDDDPGRENDDDPEDAVKDVVG